MQRETRCMGMNKNILSAALIWLVVCCYFLLEFLEHRYDLSSEIETLLFLKMLIVTFPSGFIGGVISGIILGFLELSVMARNILTWFLMTLFGFTQWFILIPVMIKVTKKRKTKKQAKTQ
jgi:hypothetical protein